MRVEVPAGLVSLAKCMICHCLWEALFCSFVFVFLGGVGWLVFLIGKCFIFYSGATPICVCNKIIL